MDPEWEEIAAAQGVSERMLLAVTAGSIHVLSLPLVGNASNTSRGRRGGPQQRRVGRALAQAAGDEQNPNRRFGHH